MNVWDILILAAVAALVVLAVIRMRRRKRSGRCSCGCEGCGMPCEKKTGSPQQERRKDEKTKERQGGDTL